MAKFYFYYAAMNAGKSATLLQSNHNYRSNGMHTALFTPRLDNRYGQGQITSRIGLQASAHAFESDFDLSCQIFNWSNCFFYQQFCAFYTGGDDATAWTTVECVFQSERPHASAPISVK